MGTYKKFSNFRIVVLSDTHGHLENISIPDGDILIHAGDLWSVNDIQELEELGKFFSRLTHEVKILVPGNHDFIIESQSNIFSDLVPGVMLLIDKPFTWRGLKIFGSPWQPWFPNWAFYSKEIESKWNLIPHDTNILITHIPPYGHLDRSTTQELTGDKQLNEAVKKINPDIHIFGHIHEGNGIEQTNQTLFVNASICDSKYEMKNEPYILKY